MYSFFAIIGNIGVPFFIILTGYLMFHRDYENTEYLHKYLAKNLLPLIIAYEFWIVTWNLFLYTHILPFAPQSWTSIIKAALFVGDTNSALWYLPMIIAVYLGMPLLATAYRRISSPMYIQIVFVALLLCGVVIPSVDIFYAYAGTSLNIHSVLKMNVFGATVWGESVWMIYLFAGYAVYKGKLKRFSAKRLMVAGVLMPLFLICIMTYICGVVEGNHHSFILLVLLSVSAFELLTRTEDFLKNHAYCKKIVHTVSNISFTIYMLHILVSGTLYYLLSKSQKTIDFIGMSAGMTNIFLYAVFIAVVVFIIYLFAQIFQKNRFIKRYILLMK